MLTLSQEEELSSYRHCKACQTSLEGVYPLHTRVWRGAKATKLSENIPESKCTVVGRAKWSFRQKECRPAQYSADGNYSQPVASSHSRWYVGVPDKALPALPRQNTSVWCKTRHKTVEFGGPEARRAGRELRELQTNTNMDNHRVFKR